MEDFGENSYAPAEIFPHLGYGSLTFVLSVCKLLTVLCLMELFWTLFSPAFLLE